MLVSFTDLQWEIAIGIRSVSRRKFVGASSAAVFGLALGCRAGGKDDEPPTEPQFDLIVVGSGFAGSFLGLRAVHAGLSTLIIEAGGDLPRPGRIAESFDAELTGEIPYPIAQTRVIGVGGTSAHWGGVISRPFPEDFRMRSEYGLLSDWPISYTDVEEYLCESESLLKVRGSPFRSGEPPRKCTYPQEYPVPAPDIVIDDMIPAYIPVPRSREVGRDAIRLSRNVIPEFEGSRYATLVRREQVTQIVTTDGRRIDHLETYREDGSIGRYSAKEYVIAAGAIETPRLLLLSRSQDHPNGLGNRSGLVGRYLSVHPSFESTFVADSWVGSTPGEYRAFEPIERMRRQGLGGYHLHLGVGRSGRVAWRVQPEMEPRLDNRIELSSTQRDLSGSPLPAIHLSFSDGDARTFEHAREFLRETKSSLAARTDTIRDFERWRSHPSGACRMGFSAETGVVDSNNRVFGLENLYLSGACTFTTAGTANPTNLVVALTLRLADHLISRQQRGGA